MKVAVRVDASQAIGTGHVRRMVSLASALQRAGADVRFIWRDLGLDVGAMLPAPHWNLPPLPSPRPDFIPEAGAHSAWAGVPAATDAAETLARVAGFEPDWLIVDHYSFGLDWHRTVRQAARLVVIDDLADRPISADLIVDHNFHPSHEAKYAAVNVDGAMLLGGPTYAMLAEIYASAPRYPFSASIRSVGIFMGGVDAPDVSRLALDALQQSGLDAAVEIVTTDANPNLAALMAAAAARPRTTVSLNLPDLAGFFGRHDLQIGAGGGALWERFCLGAPTVAVISAENQRESVPYLESIGLVRMADALQPRDIAVAQIAGQIEALAAAPEEREAMSRRGRAMVDGHGTTRIVEAMRQFAEGGLQ